MSRTQTPHANHAGLLCTMVRLVCTLPDLTDAALGNALGLSPRHLAYYYDSARLLGLLEGTSGRGDPTTRGRRLAVATPGSPLEKATFREGVESNPDLKRWVLGDLTDEELVASLQEAGLARSSAERRAGCVRAWRHFALGEAEVTFRRPRRDRRMAAVTESSNGGAVEPVDLESDVVRR